MKVLIADGGNFGFSIAVIAQRLVPKPSKGGKCFSSLASLLAFFNTRCRWVDGHVLQHLRVARNLAAARFLHFGLRALGLETLIQQNF
ncbi:hypothetical protein BV494_06350 [Rahnella sikkimica]|uniref:Uncharacterized protein n=1 Tax=Rahnella sikkimica TaxID=1805933 RepID=A0A2L1UNS1_9GAMM|nr:hypothetical protein BV494_06350 [Rahnella sikkimica]